jgi:alginate O-acetyltransferase complex protein AlgI
MLFNSFGFLFMYLPVVLAGHLALARWSPRWTAAWLALASLFFYGYWDARYLPLLMASIIFNFWTARRMTASTAHRKRWLVFALAANLALLGYYKYANFLLWQDWAIVLPVGISFFTFTQIAFLVDCYRASAGEYRLVHYILFVSYFPHLIAGPVLHHKEMMPQFDRQPQPDTADFAVGLSIFVVGLAKKVLLADPISVLVGPVFTLGAQPQLVEAWIGALAYSFQLYFDFSGYSDMAIGLSRMLGVKLPLNFNSPYRAANISEFWRRWHMTLSRFLRDYLYVPLGGNRDGARRRYRNLMLTMLLGGLWHGAGWTFVVWGGLHGVYLVLHHGWQARGGKIGATVVGQGAYPAGGGRGLGGVPCAGPGERRRYPARHGRWQRAGTAARAGAIRRFFPGAGLAPELYRHPLDRLRRRGGADAAGGDSAGAVRAEYARNILSLRALH